MTTQNKVTACFGLSETIVYRVAALRSRPQHQGIREAVLFHFRGRHAMPRNVLDSVLRPDQLVDSHGAIVQE